MHYNAAGQVVQRDKPSGVGAYYKYDSMGHLTEEVRYPSGDRIRYAHDVAGGTVRVEKSGVPTERWYFDAAGRLTHHRSVQPGGVSVGLPMGVNSPGFAGASGPSYDLYYEYDEAGNRTKMAFLGGGVTYFTYYEYDARNLLSALTDPLGQTVYYERDELGREVQKRLPNGVGSIASSRPLTPPSPASTMPPQPEWEAGSRPAPPRDCMRFTREPGHHYDADILEGGNGDALARLPSRQSFSVLQVPAHASLHYSVASMRCSGWLSGSGDPSHCGGEDHSHKR